MGNREMITVSQPNNPAHHAVSAASWVCFLDSWSCARKEKIKAANPRAIVTKPDKQEKHTATIAKVKWVLIGAFSVKVPWGRLDIFGDSVWAVCSFCAIFSPFRKLIGFVLNKMGGIVNFSIII